MDLVFGFVQICRRCLLLWFGIFGGLYLWLLFFAFAFGIILLNFSRMTGFNALTNLLNNSEVIEFVVKNCKVDHKYFVETALIIHL